MGVRFPTTIILTPLFHLHTVMACPSVLPEPTMTEDRCTNLMSNWHCCLGHILGPKLRALATQNIIPASKTPSSPYANHAFWAHHSSERGGTMEVMPTFSPNHAERLEMLSPWIISSPPLRGWWANQRAGSPGHASLVTLSIPNQFQTQIQTNLKPIHILKSTILNVMKYLTMLSTFSIEPMISLIH